MKVGFYTVVLVVVLTLCLAGVGYMLKSTATIRDLEKKLAKAESAQQNLLNNKLTQIRKDSVRVQGKMESAKAVAVSPQVNAPLSEVLVQEGETVAAGQVLAKLETTGLQADVANAKRAWADARRRLESLRYQYEKRDQRYAEAQENAELLYQNNVAYFEKELEDSGQQVAKCRIAVEANALEADRKAELAEEKLVSQAAYERAKLALEQSRIDLKLAQAIHTDLQRKTQGNSGEGPYIRLREAELLRETMLEDARVERVTEDDLARAEAEVEACALNSTLAEQHLDSAVIRAAMRGVVSEASNSPRLAGLRTSLSSGHPLSFEELREVGKRVGPQNILFVLEGLSEVVVKVDVDERDINLIRVGSPAVISGTGFKENTLAGEVSAISPEATYVGEGITTFETTVKVVDELGTARLGMSAEVEILTGETE